MLNGSQAGRGEEEAACLIMSVGNDCARVGCGIGVLPTTQASARGDHLERRKPPCTITHGPANRCLTVFLQQSSRDVLVPNDSSPLCTMSEVVWSRNFVKEDFFGEIGRIPRPLPGWQKLSKLIFSIERPDSRLAFLSNCETR